MKLLRSIAICFLLGFTVHGQFLNLKARAVIKPPRIEKPFSLSFDCPEDPSGMIFGAPSGIPYGFTPGKWPFMADFSISNGVCTIRNLYRTNTYYFSFIRGDYGSGDPIEIQWRPERTNYITVSLAGLTNCLTFTNPTTSKQFWKLRGNSWTGADLLATDRPELNLWLKVAAFNYPSGAVPNLVVTQSNSWAGLPAYETPQ